MATGWISENSHPNNWSRTNVNKPIPTTNAIVKIVAETHSSRVGQVTRRNSAITPRTKSCPTTRWAAFDFCSFTKGCLPKIWQGGQDSNLQPAVLETAALPIAPPPYLFVFGFVDAGLVYLSTRRSSSPSQKRKSPSRWITSFRGGTGDSDTSGNTCCAPASPRSSACSSAYCSSGACTRCTPLRSLRAFLSSPLAYHKHEENGPEVRSNSHSSIPPRAPQDCLARLPRTLASPNKKGDTWGPFPCMCARPESNWQPWA